MDILLYVLVIISVFTSVFTLVYLIKNGKATLSQADKQDIASQLSNQIAISNTAINNQLAVLSKSLTESQKVLVEQILKISEMQQKSLEEIRKSIERSIKGLQDDNNKQLDKMRETVDEKLSKTINERFDQSFKVLSEQLDRVSKSLGEMQNMAQDVGSLSKMLSNVKTRGIFGEIQLGAILEQMLAPEQYEKDAITAEGREPVEFAIKYQADNDGNFVYLPIDSKFPLTIYQDMQDAYEKNDFELVKQKQAQMVSTIKKMANDIYTKYIYPPKTTDFAIMFLPIEGLYADVAKLNIVNEIQTKYHVTIVGPTTLTAFLSSLQMGFKTLAIQKKSVEIYKVLQAVSTEFDKFNDVIGSIQKRFKLTNDDFDELIGKRSRMLARKLKNVERLSQSSSDKILSVVDDSGETEDK